MKYIQMLNLEDDEFEVTSATAIEEIKKLGNSRMDKIRRIGCQLRASALLQKA